MMRSGELSYWLDSGHLLVDGSVAALVPKDLEKADKFLKEAKEKKDFLDQINVSYLSMYSSAQALVHSIHYKATNFSCLVKVLEEYFVRKGTLENKFVELLLKGQKIEGTPDENFQAAEYCISAAKKMLGK